MCRIGAELLHPLAQHVLMNVRIPPSLRQRNRRCFTNLTAWILNSRVYLRLSMTHLRLHETPNLGVHQMAAAQPRQTSAIGCSEKSHA